MAWQFLGVSNVVEVTGTAHALVTTGIAGTLQAGDLLVACISSRIASTTSVTLPTGGEWTLVSEQKNNNILATGSAASSGLMAYCVRGASNPNLTFTHPVAPSVAIGRIVAYRDVKTAAPKDTQASFTTAISITAVSGTGLTTTLAGDLIVAMAAGGQEAAWSSFNATSPSGASGATSTAAPTTTWLERADSVTTTGVDTSLGIFDAIKTATGATGNLTVTASVAAAHVVVAGAFAFNEPATGVGTPTGRAATASGLGVSESTGTGTPAGQAAAVSGAGGVSSTDAWNVFDKSASVALSNSDKTATLSTDVCAVRSTKTYLNGAVGKYYFELLCSDISGGQAGIADATTEVTSGTSAVYVLGTTGVVYRSGVSAGITLGALANGSVLCVAWDSFAKRIWFRVNNGLWNNNAAALPATGANGLNVTALAINNHAIWAYSTSGASDPSTVTVRTESAEFTYTVPSGFTPWVVEALAAVEGTGALAAQAAAVSGSGSVGAEAATGTGAIAAGASVVSGAGVSSSIAVGALGAQGDSYWRGRSASVDSPVGFATVSFDRHGRPGSDFAGKGSSRSTGTSSLVAQAAAVSGAGNVGSAAATGTGALAAAAAVVNGAGISDSVAAGALTAQAAIVAGSGLSVSAGSGALQADAASVAGAGAAGSAGSGYLIAGSADVAGAGTAAAGDSGALVTEAATIAGLGVSESTGTGALQAGAAAIAGAGLGDSIGTGPLVAGAATITAEGVVLEEGASTGIGALVAGVATLSGEGEVTGEVIVPPIVSVGGGYYRPARPFLVEGIGYGILPQLEGEAFGLVVVSGTGVASLPGIVGAGTGAVGVAGRSAARLGIIKVAAVGARGQIGSGSGSLVGVKAAAIGRHDDDGAAIVAFLLAA